MHKAPTHQRGRPCERASINQCNGAIISQDVFDKFEAQTPKGFHNIFGFMSTELIEQNVGACQFLQLLL